MSSNNGYPYQPPQHYYNPNQQQQLQQPQPSLSPHQFSSNSFPSSTTTDPNLVYPPTHSQPQPPQRSVSSGSGSGSRNMQYQQYQNQNNDYLGQQGVGSFLNGGGGGGGGISYDKPLPFLPHPHSEMNSGNGMNYGYSGQGLINGQGLISGNANGNGHGNDPFVIPSNNLAGVGGGVGLNYGSLIGNGNGFIQTQQQQQHQFLTSSSNGMHQQQQQHHQLQQPSLAYPPIPPPQQQIHSPNLSQNHNNLNGSASNNTSNSNSNNGSISPYAARPGCPLGEIPPHIQAQIERKNVSSRVPSGSLGSVNANGSGNGSGNGQIGDGLGLQTKELPIPSLTIPSTTTTSTSLLTSTSTSTSASASASVPPPLTSINPKKLKKELGHVVEGSAISSASVDGQSEAGEGGKKKGGPPPAKAACLSCRSRKARCDGTQPICGQCSSKGRECVFVKSKRGGARKKKEAAPPPPNPLAVYLKQLDGLMSPAGDILPDLNAGMNMEGIEGDIESVLRVYEEEDVEEILKAYYEEIHPFQPLLPPMSTLPLVMQRISPQSPFLLGVRCILSLSPSPTDPNPNSQESKAIRRKAAAKLARATTARIEQLLTEAGEDDDRLPPIDCVQALSLMGLYEFGQTGNAARNRANLNRAVEVAMEMGLHQVDKRRGNSGSAGGGGSGRSQSGSVISDVVLEKSVEGADFDADMSRRTWWVVFAASLISGLISGKRPLVAADDSRITCHYPACSVADDSWLGWIEAIRLACQAMNLIMTLDYNMPDPNLSTPPLSGESTSESSDEEDYPNPEARSAARTKKHLHRNMVQLDKTVLALLQKAEKRAIVPLVPGGEEEVARNQQLATNMMLAVCHIQLHRRQAFPEVALFSRKMCGLPKAEGFAQEGPTPPLLSTPSSTSLSPAVFHRASASDGSATGTDFVAPGNQGVASGSSSAQNHSPSTVDLPYGYSNGAIGNREFSGIPMDGLLWDSSLYPSSFPTPWFAAPF